ncbi:hypothetical protein [Paenibacillus sp.]|jgi:uncharacterized Zn finger protein|uniref:hypothetical protein n=1 Tax=Paenibacillus sp. TaxID=58172 RepID=UPI00282D2CE4|nr:hypothetical protein [Paenibacillus sp.]MDR0269217.1 hypothetical protein [Paenibacillus sp.]
MIKKRETFELSIVPGRIHATAAQNMKTNGVTPKKEASWEVDIPFSQWTAEERADICEKLAEHPYEVYALLKGQTPPWLTQAFHSRRWSEFGQAACSCGLDGCLHIPSVMAEADQRIQSDPLLGLALMGLMRERLLNAVFQDWAGKVPEAAESESGEDLSKLEEKGKVGPSSGEWLAEAAEQGKLHEPGAAYNEVTIQLKDIPDGEVVIDDWTELLPKVKAVQQVIRQITSEAGVKAQESLGLIKKSV